MISLRIGNSSSRITGLTVPQFKALREELSYSIPKAQAYFQGGHRSPKRYLIDARGNFPTGLLPTVQDWLPRNNIQYAEHNTRQVPAPRHGMFKLSLPHTPYPEQIAAARACQDAHRGIVVAPTGVGKSVICALIIDAIRTKALVVVPSLELKRQLTEGLQAAFPATRVGSVESMSNIAVENVDALDPTQPLKGYDCVIIDEFHHSGAATYRKLNQKAWGGVYYRFGLTATPFRSKDEERLLLESVLSEVIYRVDYQAAVAKGYIVPLEAYYVDVEPSEMKGNPTSWAAVYSELVVRNERRNQTIADIMRHLHVAGKSTLCLVKEIAHGESISLRTGAGFANGQGDDCKELISWFSSGQLKTLIGTTGVVGEGVDTRSAEWIILAGGGKSKNQFMQACGRGFRRYPGKESCKVILFRDPSNKWLLEHYRACVRYLKEEYGVIPVRLP